MKSKFKTFWWQVKISETIVFESKTNRWILKKKSFFFAIFNIIHNHPQIVPLIPLFMNDFLVYLNLQNLRAQHKQEY